MKNYYYFISRKKKKPIVLDGLIELRKYSRPQKIDLIIVNGVMNKVEEEHIKSLALRNKCKIKLVYDK